MFLAISPITNPAIPDLKDKQPVNVFGTFFAGIIGAMLIIGSIYALFMFLTGGFEWISSGGDKGKLENAQGRIRNALLGMIVLFGAWSIYIVILQFLGIIGKGPDIEFKLPTIV